MNKSVVKNKNGAGSKRGLSNTLSDKQIADAELLFYEHNNIVKVHELTGHSRPTLTKYMRAGKWKQKLKKIREKISLNIAKEMAKRGTDEALTDIEMVENLTRKVYTRVDSGLESILFDTSVSDFDKMLRLYRLVTGKDDRTPDKSIVNIINPGNYEQLSDKELEARAKQVLADFKPGPNGGASRF